MSAENRQIYRSASGGNRFLNRKQKSQNIGGRYNRRTKLKVEDSIQQNFGNDIKVEEIKEVEEELSQVEQLEAIANSTAEVPRFPFFTFYIALVLDILDLADFTGVGWVIMSGIEILFTIFLFFLMWRKVSTIFKIKSKILFGNGRNSLAQKTINKILINTLKKYMSRRLLGTLVVNVVPVLGIFASQAFFVFLAHNKQKKIAKAYIGFVDEVTDILKGYYKRVNAASNPV